MRRSDGLGGGEVRGVCLRAFARDDYVCGRARFGATAKRRTRRARSCWRDDDGGRGGSGRAFALAAMLDLTCTQAAP